MVSEGWLGRTGKAPSLQCVCVLFGDFSVSFAGPLFGDVSPITTWRSSGKVKHVTLYMCGLGL